MWWVFSGTHIGTIRRPVAPAGLQNSRVDATQIFPCVNWQAVAAVTTLAAVLVALLLSWRQMRRRKARGRSPRFGLCSKLTVLRPSLGAIVRGGHSPHLASELSPKAFREAVRSAA